ITKGDISKAVGTFYGLAGVKAVDFSRPALLVFTEGVETPLTVLRLNSKDDLLTILPSDPVQNRQGNELTFPIDLTRAAYINFFGDFVVLSADWRQYPLLREALPGLMETEGEALLSGVFDLERAPRSLSRNLEGLAPPSLPLKVGWDEGLRSEEHTSELQSRENLVCRLLLEKK